MSWLGPGLEKSLGRAGKEDALSSFEVTHPTTVTLQDQASGAVETLDNDVH